MILILLAARTLYYYTGSSRSPFGHWVSARSAAGALDEAQQREMPCRRCDAMPRRAADIHFYRRRRPGHAADIDAAMPRSLPRHYGRRHQPVEQATSRHEPPAHFFAGNARNGRLELRCRRYSKRRSPIFSAARPRLPACGATFCCHQLLFQAQQTHGAECQLLARHYK